ncbi:MAG: ROK family protein [Actinomycetota bacterium]
MSPGPDLVGLDLGGTALKAALVQVGDEVVIKRTHVLDTPRTGAPDELIDSLVEAANLVSAGGRVTGVGVGVPGQFDVATGTLRALPNVPGSWQGYPLRGRLAAALSLPVHVVNDSQAFTLAEASIGAATGRRTVLGVTLGTGIGGGVCLNGRIHRGANGAAGEIGHQVIVADGPVCGCGRRGCLEAIARPAVLASLAGKATAAEAFDAVRAGEPRALEALATITGYLGIGLANVIAVIDPDVVVVGGGLAQAGDLLLEPLRAAIRRCVSVVPPASVAVVEGSLGTIAGAVGAALACSS